MKKLARKIIYNYVFKRLVAWFKGELVDQELTDAIYAHDIYYDIPESMSNEVKGCLKWPNLKRTK